MTSKREKDYSIFLAAIVSFIYFLFGSTWSKEGQKNIKIYAVGLVIWLASYLFFYFVLHFLNKKTDVLSNKVVNIIISFILLVLGVIWMCGAYNAEVYVLDTGNDNSPRWFLRHNMPHVLYIILLIAFSFLFIELIKKDVVKAKSKAVRWIVIVVNAIMQSFIIFTPNFYEDTYGQVYHIDAYCNSIINCLRGLPFDETNFSVYGHYGIFYILPVRLLKLIIGNEWLAIAIIITIIGVISFVLQGMIIDKLVDNDVIFVFALAASALPSFQSYIGAYFQVYPHRLIFPAIVMWGCIKACENNTPKTKYAMWIICALANLWNLETGIICLSVWVLCNLYLEMYEYGKYSLIIVFRNVLFAIGSFLMAYVLFCIYNKVQGGALQSIYIFIHKLHSDNFAESLQLSLPTSYNGYFLVITMFMGVISYYLIDIFKLKIERKNFPLVIISIMGAGLFAYYINRAVFENKSIIAFEFMVVLAIVCDKLAKMGDYCLLDKDDDIRVFKMPVLSARKICGCGLIVVLVSTIFSLIVSVGGTIDVKSNTSLEMDSIDSLSEELQYLLPEDTVAYAYGSPELFSYMNRDTGIYITDLPDLLYAGGPTAMGYTKLYNELYEKKYEYLLVNLGEYVIIPKEYEEIYSNTIFNSSIKVYHYGKLPSSYQLVYNYLRYIGNTDYNFDDIIKACSNIDKDDDFIEELWRIGEKAGCLSNDMDDVSYICLLYENIVGRKVTDDELEMFDAYLDTGVTKEEAFKEFIRQEGVQDDARRIAIGE